MRNPKFGTWISVKDALPKENQKILAFVKVKDFEFQHVLIYKGCFWDKLTSTILNSYIDFWMPLPPNPNE